MKCRGIKIKSDKTEAQIDYFKKIKTEFGNQGEEGNNN